MGLLEHAAVGSGTFEIDVVWVLKGLRKANDPLETKWPNQTANKTEFRPADLDEIQVGDDRGPRARRRMFNASRR